MTSNKTIVIYSTAKKTFATLLQNYKKSSKHKYYAEVDIPEEFDITFSNKKTLKEYIVDYNGVVKFIQNELQSLVDSCK